MRIEELFRQKLGTEISLADVRVECAKCSLQETLESAVVVEIDGATLYTCRNDCGPLLKIVPSRSGWRDSGYLVGSHRIVCGTDVYVRVPGTENGIKIPATKQTRAD